MNSFWDTVSKWHGEVGRGGADQRDMETCWRYLINRSGRVLTWEDDQKGTIGGRMKRGYYEGALRTIKQQPHYCQLLLQGEGGNSPMGKYVLRLTVSRGVAEAVVA